ncbi:MAG: DUF885 domain-containing protein [Candidatus Bathyarchaeia archaeon]
MGKLNADEAFEKLAKEMLEQFLDKNPDFATYLGLHEPYDYMLPKGSTEKIVENLQLMEEWLKRLNMNINRAELNSEHKIDWAVLEKVYELWKFDFYERRMHELNPDVSEELGGLIFIMFTREYAPLEKRIDAIAARIEKMPKFLEEFRSRFEKSQPVKLWTELAIEKTQNMMGLFMFILQTAMGKVSDEVYHRLQKAIEGLQPALKVHMEWLYGLLSKTKEEWALGREKFEKLIQLRELGMNSAEILQLGIKYLEELKAERERVAKQIAPGKSVEEVLAMIESKAPKTFEEALEFTRKTMEEARNFVREKNIATIYPEDVLLVEETPAFLAPVVPFAALMMPAKFDKPQIGIYIVTRPKNLANLGKHLNYPSIRNTAVHEAFPGHFLQGAISNRGSVIRLLAEGTETVEGWAHYCEELMREKGFITDLETQFIQVNDMIWRAVRIIVDVKLSRGEMSFEEAVRMLMREANMSEEAAVAEVKRYTQTPGYQLSYLLGKHLILQLKEEIKKKMGDKFDEKNFHDTVLSNGYLPLSMLRKVFDQKINALKSFSDKA